MTERAVRAFGPLVVCDRNPRYFTVKTEDGHDGDAIYLTGSHIWNMRSEPGAMESSLEYGAFLSFLEDHGHNFVRLWRWEHFARAGDGMTPQPWPRPGPGTATDGDPKFDLSSFDERYFDQLRDRVCVAGDRGIYVAVMLFEGFGLHLLPPPEHVEGHPFHAANNINGIGIESIVDYQVLPLDPLIQALQEAYVRKVVDTVGDLPNVLYEIVNESSGDGTMPDAAVQALGLDPESPVGDSTQWQYWVIDLVKRFEQLRGLPPHPVGMTAQFPVRDQARINEPLLNGPAEWISPGFDDDASFDALLAGAVTSRWLTDPPANDGRKVVITDTDHYAPGRGDPLWAWKSFLRGYQPILMDFGLSGGVAPGEHSAAASYNAFEPARYAMGDTLRYAQTVDLIAMSPRPDLASTGFALANPGAEYLVLQPNETIEPFTVTLTTGRYRVQWFDVMSRQTSKVADVTVDRSSAIEFRPLSTPAVLYLKRDQ
jgi:hypothetical protein